MRIVIDALCAEFGGIRTYVEHLLRAWPGLYPEDEVHVMLRAGSTLATTGLHRHELGIRGPGVIGRPWVQATRMHRLTTAIGPDVILATAPTTDVRRPAAPLMVVILDLRAEILPDQFSRGRRLLRRMSYGRSYRLASGFVAISQRSLDDLHRLHPRTAARRGTVAHLGSDHVHDWPAPTTLGPAVAFAHHTNKNPDLVIDAWAELARDGATPPALTFLGVSGELRPRLEQRIAAHNLDEVVTLSRFLPDDEFHSVITRASMIVFPSDFEGFGLPIVEGMALGKPVVIGPDTGCLEVAGAHAEVMDGWSAGALAAAVRRAQRRTAAQEAAASAWAARFTWRETVTRTRAALAELIREER